MQAINSRPMSRNHAARFLLIITLSIVVLNTIPNSHNKSNFIPLNSVPFPKRTLVCITQSYPVCVYKIYFISCGCGVQWLSYCYECGFEANLMSIRITIEVNVELKVALTQLPWTSFYDANNSTPRNWRGSLAAWVCSVRELDWMQE